ncbi:hypothetical protein ED28_01870 [[Pantoea] beijingensis]|uniref:UPF0225 protein ED28_01870 n=1 Tax=[Pantoea] beijingensis TaxID=1324864 RepID=A0A443IIA6_9GAMM|nr:MULTISPECIES: YchJ family protein [Erwiniaceae]RWR03759.1 hypothetical protein ED28_01870 [[Pantoea] beijingensis]
MSEKCPCCSGLEYNACCKSFLNGAIAPSTAEQLMRSRYTAYAKQNIEWLISTWHRSTRAPQLQADIEASFDHTKWLNLNVVSTEAGSHDNEAFVTFFARFLENHKNGAIHERSRFVREDQRWYYIDGTHPQLGRNDRCPCGSEKKHKKCCGQ